MGGGGAPLLYSHWLASHFLINRGYSGICDLQGLVDGGGVPLFYSHWLASHFLIN